MATAPSPSLLLVVDLAVPMQGLAMMRPSDNAAVLRYGAVRRSARLSIDGVYRYELTRQWGPGPSVTWVMLNPSTADAEIDDPTIRRCIGFTRSWDWDGIRVVNLFALRATNPKELMVHEQPFGLGNERAIEDAIEGSYFTVAAWGSNVPPWGDHLPRLVDALCIEHHKPLRCLGTTKTGAPRHPLYVKGDQPLRRWPA